MIETRSAPAESSIKILNEAYKKYRHLRPILEFIVGHGTQLRQTRETREVERGTDLKSTVIRCKSG